MPAPRTPKAKAMVSGQAAKNPQRFRPRKDPKSTALGEASSFLVGNAVAAWDGFRRELPWLTENHRALVEIAARIRGRLMDGEDVGVQALNLLRQCLGQMGATPADATKVPTTDGDEEDPEDALFGRPN